MLKSLNIEISSVIQNTTVVKPLYYNIKVLMACCSLEDCKNVEALFNIDWSYCGFNPLFCPVVKKIDPEMFNGLVFKLN
ncbi:hypothetical protein QA601_00985 [Chitinispirillales bacterium ANBcel5]|uniref:hypothetical protein n=1 Tax=Cellulosispirillum alkaliphilum TaxID=3039283 RepID=UPI002A5852A0|nr:hypothetical protein [Chitinispirillales bacterium ANBcel5]